MRVADHRSTSVSQLRRALAEALGVPSLHLAAAGLALARSRARLAPSAGRAVLE